ncbi:hypothetical protein [Mesorhizobium sp. M0239]|uniref:hypothetical protein n=1 Tax=Mesorhizobium sp. M0239 TaxID=2956924 RepID=UPI0033351E67
MRSARTKALVRHARALDAILSTGNADGQGSPEQMRELRDARSAFEKVRPYSIACQAEVEATTAVLKLQDKLPHIQARSLLGIVAKLEIIAGADRDIDDPTDFPWPHIASILDDLKKIVGSLPRGRPERSVVQADCRQYQAIAANLVGLGKPGRHLHLGFSVHPSRVIQSPNECQVMSTSAHSSDA